MKCKIIEIRDIPILVMEYVKQLPYKDQPDWAAMIDGGQVGKNKKGNIVAFDYGWN
mgnify:CR=1 FL=1